MKTGEFLKVGVGTVALVIIYFTFACTKPSTAPPEGNAPAPSSHIAVGGGHTLAIKTNGTLWAWGDNYYGQLGLGDNTNRNSPTQVFF